MNVYSSLSPIMRSRIIFFSLALVILLLSLIGIMLWRLYPGNKIISEGEYEGVIFHNRNAARVLRFMLINDNIEDAYWIPTRADITELEKQIYIHTLEQAPVLAAQLPAYKRQYYGFIRAGREFVFIVGFCETDIDTDWRNELVSLPMAGDCYFLKLNMMLQMIV